MTHIIALSGSLRRDSYNTALLKTIKTLLPQTVSMDIASIRGIPLYDGDAEAENGIPQAVSELKTAIQQADALLISTPEYNCGIPGVLKNTIDWLTRPPADIPQVFGNRKVGLIGASAGRLGTALSQSAWLPTLRFLNVDLYTEKSLFISGVHTLFDQNGQLQDDATQHHLQAYVDGFIAYLQKS